MEDLHVSIEPQRIVTSTLILRSWSAEDDQEAFEIYGDAESAEAIGMVRPVGDLAEMRERLIQWDLRSSQSPVPQGLWAVEAVDDGRLLGGATLLPFSPSDPRLVMGWHVRSDARGRGTATRIGHALAHQAFLAGDVEEVFVAAPARYAGSIAAARRLGMTTVDGFDWVHRGVRLVGGAMVWRVLDEIRTRAGTVTLICPFVVDFVSRTTTYADLIDPRHPGYPDRASAEAARAKAGGRDIPPAALAQVVDAVKEIDMDEVRKDIATQQ